MSVAMVAAGVATVAGAAITADSQRRSANMQRDAANAANQLSADQNWQARQDQMPWQQAGSRALGRAEFDMSQPEWTRPFGLDQFQADPGYQFRIDQGNRALDRRAASGGKFFSGGALRDASRFNQDLASQEYGNAFNRFQTDRQNRLNPLLSMAGLGQSSAGQLGQLGAQSSMYQGNNLIGAGDAQAAGIVGRNNSFANGANQLYGVVRGFQGSQGQSTQNRMQQAQPIDGWGFDYTGAEY